MNEAKSSRRREMIIQKCITIGRTMGHTLGHLVADLFEDQSTTANSVPSIPKLKPKRKYTENTNALSQIQASDIDMEKARQVLMQMGISLFRRKDV